MEPSAVESLNLIIPWFLIFPGASFPPLASLLKLSHILFGIIKSDKLT